MAAPKKFGAFAGVFTPSILTILGVIMYMRFGWIVGNAGLWGTLIIVFIAHIISFTTGLSISSIATDKKIGAGGVYYVLSRSLGLPIGGAIGLTLFIGTAFSIALYLIGFSESFNEFLGFDTTLNGYRITASATLLMLTIIAFISTSIALKTQFFILVAIILSLVSIFFGHSDFVPDTVNTFGGADSVPMETVFAIFFPAVTGFTAGIAMSGDLKDPKKSIPSGTMMAIVVGLLVYVGLAVFIALKINSDVLKTDNGILLKIAMYSPLVVAGIWGATLSSAIGGILGGPRILQAMSIDKITPVVFGKGHGKNNEPRVALILTVIIAFGGVMIGELNLIARLVSMFYLAAYGFINLSFFLESWASSDFKPSFKVNKWIGFVGFITTFIIMFRLDMLAMFLSFVVIGGVYLWLSKKQISLGEGDIWQSVWTNIVKKGLRRLDNSEDHKRNWKPNILLFSGKKKTRVHLLEFSRFLAGQTGIVTNFDLTENKNAGELFSKNKQSYNDEVLEEYGIFGRQLEVKSIYEGIGTIASVFGFSGIEPNTVMMGWARNAKEPQRFSQMTNKLIELDYNVLYLDYDKEMGFGKYKTIDLWWRGISSNAELSLMIVKLLLASSEWGMAKIRIILVNNTGNDHQLIKRRIENLAEAFRVKVEVFIINNFSENKSIYELMKIYSGTTDLIILGVPEIVIGEEDKFVDQVNDLVDVLGTTLLVKASSKFEVVDLGLKNNVALEDNDIVDFAYMPILKKSKNEKIQVLVNDLDKELLKLSNDFKNTVLLQASNELTLIIKEFEREIKSKVEGFEKSDKNVLSNLIDLNEKLKSITIDFAEHNLKPLEDIIDKGIHQYIEDRKALLLRQPISISLEYEASQSGSANVVEWREKVLGIDNSTFIKDYYVVLKVFLSSQSKLITSLPYKTQNVFLKYIDNISVDSSKNLDYIELLKEEFNGLFKEFSSIAKESKKAPSKQLRFIDRTLVNKISEVVETDMQNKGNTRIKLSRKERKVNKDYLSKVNEFSNLWLGVNEGLWSKVEIDFIQGLLYINIRKETDQLKDKLTVEVFDKIERIIGELEKFIVNIDSTNDDVNDFTVSSKDFKVEFIQFEQNQILSELHSSLSEYLNEVPVEISVISNLDYNELLKNQLDELDQVELPLKLIDNHLISSKLLSPFEKRFNLLNDEIEEIKTKITSLVSLLNYTFNSIKQENGAELTSLIANIKNEFGATKEKYGYEVVQFNEHCNQIVNQLGLTLNSDSILNNISEINLNIKKKKKQSGIGLAFRRVNNSIVEEKKKIIDFVSRKNEAVKRFEYERELAAYIPEHLKLKEQINSISEKRDIIDLLPYYYHQIFTGKHFLVNDFAVNRAHELMRCKEAFDHFARGENSSVLVIGSSGIGKSFFVENFVDNNSEGKIEKLNIDHFENSSPLKEAFKKISGKEGSIEYLISGFEKGTTFVIEDIERFVNIYENKKLLLDVLSDIIHRHGSKYFFILTANSNSISLLESVSKIMGSIGSIIPLGPLSQSSISKIIKERHFSSNIKLFDKKGVIINEKGINRIIDNIIDLAKGNIGMALQLWIASMRKGENELVMDYIDIPSVKLKNPIWLSLLNRMLVFGRIEKQELKKLYGIEQLEEINKNIDLLLNSDLIECIRGSEYVIRKSIKPFAEHWLKHKDVT